MFGNLLKSFMIQVVIIKAHNIYKKLKNVSEKISISFLNYLTQIWTKINNK